jgi:peptide/nickel transport system substrate-binding protein
MRRGDAVASYWQHHRNSVITRRRVLGGVGAAGALALVAACRGSDQSGTGPQAAATTVASGGSPREVSPNAPEAKIADSGLMNAITSLDPNVATTPSNGLVNMFEPLVKLDQQFKLQPAVASKWEIVDSTTWIYTIQSGITFHNGDPLTASDVKYSLDRIMNNTKDFPQFVYYSPFIDKVETPDANTVKITTKGPNAVLANRLSILRIVPQKYIESQGLGTFRERPVGSGAYKFESWVNGQSITLTRNDSYWRGKPPFPKVTFQAVGEEATRLNLIRTRQVTLADNIPANQLDMLKAQGLKTRSNPSAQIIFIGANANEPPFNDLRVRLAVAHAIDGEAIKKAIFNDKLLLIGSAATPLDNGYDDSIKPRPYDVAKTKQLLTAAGLANGFETSLLASTNSKFFRIPEMAQAVAGQLSKVGVKVNLILEDNAKAFQDYLTGKVPGLHQFSCADIIGDISHCTQLIFRNRALYYKNDQMVALITKMDETLDNTERAKIQHQVLQMIYDEVPWVWQYAEYHNFAMDPRLEFQEVPIGLYDMYDARWNG